MSSKLKNIICFRLFFFLIACLTITNLVSQELQKPTLDFSIACGNVSNNYTFTFKFDFTGSVFNSDNQFVFLLSDANGDFTNAQEVGRVNDPNYNVMFYDLEGSFQLPTDTYGQNYKLRVKSTSPVSQADSDPFEAYYTTPKKLILNNYKDASLCTTGTATIRLNDIGSGFTYRWYLNGQLINGETGDSLTVTQTGEYYAAVDYGGCGDIVKSNKTKVVGFPNGGVQIQGNNVVELCGTDTYELKATIDNTDFIYEWYKDDNRIDSLPDYSPTYTTATTDQYGEYYVKVSSSNGCVVQSQRVTIKEPDGSGFTVDIVGEATRVLLPYETLELEVNTSSDSVTYQWFKDDVLMLGVSQSTVNAIGEGVYYAKVTDNTTSCPVTKKSPEYTVVEAISIVPVIKTDDDYTKCESEDVTLSVSEIKAKATDNNLYELSSDQLALITLQWYKNDVEMTGETTDEIAVTSYQDNAAYYVKAMYDYFNDPSNTIETSLTYPGMEITSSSQTNTLCPGATITLSTKVVSGYDYTWLKGAEPISVSDPSTLEVSEVDTYTLRINGFGCTNNLVVDITEFNDDAVQVSPDSIAVLSKVGTVVLSASGGESYAWYDANDTLLSSSETVEVSEVGTYRLESKSGICSVIKYIEVVEDDGSIIIPNVISPFNADGVNDTWQIPNRYAYQKNVHVVIYDSRGKEVLNTVEYQNNWPEQQDDVKGGMLFYFKVIRGDADLIKAGTISVLK